MGLDYSRRLSQLKQRRLGDADIRFSESNNYASTSFSQDSLSRELYENRTEKEAAKYLLGAMQAVDSDYTKTSIKEGERVIDQLSKPLAISGNNAEFKFQGSVPLDVHIKRHSDIDILVLDGRVFTYDGASAAAARINYGGSPAKSALQCLLELRSSCENILSKAFPATSIDTKGAKSITLSGGSLRRKVDVVPSHWHNTAEYITTNYDHYRAVRILDKSVPETAFNYPFLHMHKINFKDNMTNGGVKKAIRLLKTLKADCDQEIKLSSYDIASLVWHFDNGGLSKSYTRELSIVSSVQLELHKLRGNYLAAMNLDTPDGSRKIFDVPNKFTSLQKLSSELDAVVEDAALEINALASYLGRRYGEYLENIIA
jgi:hypothetical protein